MCNRIIESLGCLFLTNDVQLKRFTVRPYRTGVGASIREGDVRDVERRVKVTAVVRVVVFNRGLR